VESAETAGRRIQDMPHRRWCRVDNRTAPRQWDGSPTVGRLPDSGTASRQWDGFPNTGAVYRRGGFPGVLAGGGIVLYGFLAWASAAWYRRNAAVPSKSYRLRSVAIRTRRSSAWAADATAANCPIVAPWSARSTSAVCVVRAVRIRGTSCSRATCSPLTK